MNLHPTPVHAAVAPNSKPALSGGDTSAMDPVFDTLKAYRLGSSRAALAPLDEAVRNGLENQALRKQLEQRLCDMLSTRLSDVAKEYICSKLILIGTSQSVSALAELLSDQALSHAAVSVLETMPGPEAGEALLRRLPQLTGPPQVGVINSLGRRREAKSVPSLAKLLENPRHEVASAAAAALGRIGTEEAGRILLKFQSNPPETIRSAVADACLNCAERLMAEGHRAQAQTLYQALTASQYSRPVRAAAQHGLTAR